MPHGREPGEHTTEYHSGLLVRLARARVAGLTNLQGHLVGRLERSFDCQAVYMCG